MTSPSAKSPATRVHGAFREPRHEEPSTRIGVWPRGRGLPSCGIRGGRFPVNAGVGAVANLPCIAVQRYNRARLVRLLGRMHDAHV